MSKKPAAKPAAKSAAKPAVKPAAAAKAKAPSKSAAASKTKPATATAAKSKSSATTAAKSKPVAASKSAAASKPGAAKAQGPPGAKVHNVREISDVPTSAHVILFTACGTGASRAVNIMLVKESYGKWGIPGGGKREGEDIEMTAKREFEEETGHTLPEFKLKETFRHNNSYIILGFTEECIEPKFGSNPAMKSRGDDTKILELKHVACADILRWVANPGADFLVRRVLIDMLNDNRDMIINFCKKCT